MKFRIIAHIFGIIGGFILGATAAKVWQEGMNNASFTNNVRGTINDVIQRRRTTSIYSQVPVRDDY